MSNRISISYGKKNIKVTRNQKASKEEKFERKFSVTQLNHEFH